MWWWTSWQPCTLRPPVHVVCTLSQPKYEVAVCACLPASVVLWVYTQTDRNDGACEHVDFSWLSSRVSVSISRTSYVRARVRACVHVIRMLALHEIVKVNSVCVCVCVCVWTDRVEVFKTLVSLLINVSFCMTDIIVPPLCPSATRTWDSVKVCVSFLQFRPFCCVVDFHSRLNNDQQENRRKAKIAFLFSGDTST